MECAMNQNIASNIVSHYTKGTQEKLKGVTFAKGKNFHLTALEGGLAAHCDGETVCYDGKELEIKCIPNALRLVSPVIKTKASK
jgi:diacylglycerol kinase family enzyme